jgi:hypothetical protein
VLNTFCYKVPDLNIPGGTNTNSVWLNHQLRKHNGEIPIHIYKNWVVKTNGGKYKLNMKEVNSIEVKPTSQRKCDLGNNVLM